MYDYEWADLVDKTDKLKLIQDPESNYAQSASWALGRAMDSLIISAASGTSYRGKAGGSETDLPAAQKVTSNSTALTVAKLLEAKKKLDAADVDPEEPRFCIVTADQIEDLLNITEVKSADYNTVRSLAMGQIDSYLGFKFIMCNRLAVDTSDDRLCLAYAQKGLLLAIAQDIQVDIGPRRDKSNATQVFTSLGIGATRMEEERVIEIACSE